MFSGCRQGIFGNTYSVSATTSILPFPHEHSDAELLPPMWCIAPGGCWARLQLPVGGHSHSGGSRCVFIAQHAPFPEAARRIILENDPNEGGLTVLWKASATYGVAYEFTKISGALRGGVSGGSGGDDAGATRRGVADWAPAASLDGSNAALTVTTRKVAAGGALFLMHRLRRRGRSLRRGGDGERRRGRIAPESPSSPRPGARSDPALGSSGTASEAATTTEAAMRRRSSAAESPTGSATTTTTTAAVLSPRRGPLSFLQEELTLTSWTHLPVSSDGTTVVRQEDDPQIYVPSQSVGGSGSRLRTVVRPVGYESNVCCGGAGTNIVAGTDLVGGEHAEEMVAAAAAAAAPLPLRLRPREFCDGLTAVRITPFATFTETDVHPWFMDFISSVGGVIGFLLYFIYFADLAWRWCARAQSRVKMARRDRLRSGSGDDGPGGGGGGGAGRGDGACSSKEGTSRALRRSSSEAMAEDIYAWSSGEAMATIISSDEDAEFGEVSSVPRFKSTAARRAPFKKKRDMAT